MPYFPTIWENKYWYLIPLLRCHNDSFHNAVEHFPKRKIFALPFDDLPQTDAEQYIDSEESNRRVLPPDGWHADFACLACGLVDTYNADEIYPDIVGKESQGRYHSDGVCICVEVRCADRYCRAPAKWYVDITGATESDLQQRLQQNHFFGKLPCGHEIRTTIDKSSFQLYRVMNRLWPRSP